MSPFFTPCPPARFANGSRKNLPAAFLAALFVPHAPDEKILTNRTKESIIKHILCGYVGTGRQDGLRIRWETVQVRALLSAPRKAGKTAKTVCFFEKNPFFKNTPQTHPKIKSLLFFSKAVQMGCLFPAMRIYAIGRTGANTQVFLCPWRRLGCMKRRLRKNRPD